jgi:hypothetical protein
VTEQAAVSLGYGLGQIKPFAHFLELISTTHSYSSFG